LDFLQVWNFSHCSGDLTVPLLPGIVTVAKMAHWHQWLAKLPGEINPNSNRKKRS